MRTTWPTSMRLASQSGRVWPLVLVVLTLTPDTRGGTSRPTRCPTRSARSCPSRIGSNPCCTSGKTRRAAGT
jgi:hypothetical protein